jgi:hypothetical protein
MISLASHAAGIGYCFPNGSPQGRAGFGASKMQVTVYVYTGHAVTGIRFFRSLARAHAFIARTERGKAHRRAFIHEVTR